MDRGIDPSDCLVLARPVVDLVFSGVGLAVIAWPWRYLQHGSSVLVVVHRIVGGVLVLGLVAGGVLTAR